MNNSSSLPVSQLTEEARQARIDARLARRPSDAEMAAFRQDLAIRMGEHLEELSRIPYPRKG